MIGMPGIPAADKQASQRTGQKTSKQHALHSEACIPVVEQKNVLCLIENTGFRKWKAVGGKQIEMSAIQAGIEDPCARNASILAHFC